jgi:hypothetical protein
MVSLKDCVYLSTIALLLWFHPGTVPEATWLHWQCSTVPAVLDALLSLHALGLATFSLVLTLPLLSKACWRRLRLAMMLLYMLAIYIYMFVSPSGEYCRTAQSDLFTANQLKALFLEKQRATYEANQADSTTRMLGVLAAVCVVGMFLLFKLLVLVVRIKCASPAPAPAPVTSHSSRVFSCFTSWRWVATTTTTTTTTTTATATTTTTPPTSKCQEHTQSLIQVPSQTSGHTNHKHPAECPQPKEANANSTTHFTTYATEVFEHLQIITQDQLRMATTPKSHHKLPPQSTAKAIVHVLRFCGLTTFHMFLLLASVSLCVAVYGFTTRKGAPTPPSTSTTSLH